jgi:hypothetical protein
LHEKVVRMCFLCVAFHVFDFVVLFLDPVEPPMQLAHLPDDILVEIFSRLDLAHLAICALVCFAFTVSLLSLSASNVGDSFVIGSMSLPVTLILGDDMRSPWSFLLIPADP